MRKLHYRVEFLTPAFLGNAEQSGQWRTPPFKALLRQWWRSVWAAKHGFPTDIGDMRCEEGLLLGNAWLDRAQCKSTVRIRLSHWNAGKTKSWQGLEQAPVYHPEVQRARNKVGPHAYLGYGPLDGRGGTKLAGKVNAAVQAGETAKLSIAAPERDIADIRSALSLIDAYGTVGGRSRNGWGSVSLVPVDDSPAHETDFASWSRPWREALSLDWPHAIGRDDRGALVWRTAKSYQDWKDLMRDLAILKIGLRTMFVFPNARPPHPQVLDRHWLSYPITRHRTRQWNNSLRLPNSLHFKVRPDWDDPQRLRGVIFHVPCRPPADFRPNDDAIGKVWERSHRLLDELARPPIERCYGMIEVRERREELKPGLGKLALERSPE